MPEVGQCPGTRGPPRLPHAISRSLSTFQFFSFSQIPSPFPKEGIFVLSFSFLCINRGRKGSFHPLHPILPSKKLNSADNQIRRKAQPRPRGPRRRTTLSAVLPMGTLTASDGPKGCATPSLGLQEPRAGVYPLSPSGSSVPSLSDGSGPGAPTAPACRCEAAGGAFSPGSPLNPAARSEVGVPLPRGRREAEYGKFGEVSVASRPSPPGSARQPRAPGLGGGTTSVRCFILGVGWGGVQKDNP